MRMSTGPWCAGQQGKRENGIEKAAQGYEHNIDDFWDQGKQRNLGAK